MRNKLAIALAATVTACAFAAPAGAGPGCASGSHCLYAGKNYTGKKYVVTEPDELVAVPAAFNDKASSMKSRFEDRAYVYENANGSGQFFCLETGLKIPNLSDFSDEINNDISAARLQSGPGGCGP